MHAIAIKSRCTAIGLDRRATTGANHTAFSHRQGKCDEFGRASTLSSPAHKDGRKNVPLSSKEKGDSSHYAPLCRSPDYADRSLGLVVGQAF
jgi:hypothetical protein